MQKNRSSLGHSRTSVQKIAVKRTLSIAMLTVFFSALLLGVHAAVVTKVDIAHALYPTTTTVLLGVAQFLSSFLMLRRYRENGFLLGSGSALVVFLFLMLLSSISLGGKFTPAALTKLVIVVCAGGLGGILGVNTAEKSRKKRRLS